MHVVTFYSFKGGVGRSMALVNVAAHIASKGKRVLLVDMDLEAPGLRSFAFEITRPDTPGVVEYISDYLRTDEVPDCRDHLYQAHSFPETDGSLWIMPAGVQDASYEQRFSAINWQELYAKRDGYLLLENLREQWDEALSPDYVFIDSRTGFTDVAGICTRQLPDAVCLVFTPNPQNLFGLTQVCNAINVQKTFPTLRQPHVHFVASNVPNLDDENEVLSKTLDQFSQELGYQRLTATIHYYNSLAIIEQSPFILGHPKSRLSRQYMYLADQIAKHNPEDKESSIRFLQAVARDYPDGGENYTPKDVQLKIDQILSSIEQDNDILFWVSRVYRASGKWDECRVLLQQVISSGYKEYRAKLDLAAIKIQGTPEDQLSAVQDLLEFLNLDVSIVTSDIIFAIQVLIEQRNIDLSAIADSKAIKSLSIEDIVFLASELMRSSASVQLRHEILKKALSRDEVSNSERRDLIGALGITLISLGRLEDASDVLHQVAGDPNHADIADAFNYGFSLYWTHSSLSEVYFKRFISCSTSDYESIPSLNHLQCLSFAHWALGNSELAKRVLSRTKQLAISQFHAFTFSCWRYAEVVLPQFLNDLEDLNELYSGEALTPALMRQKLDGPAP
ncbi:ATPase [Pandoraea pneumonica]|uniref:ATPase n=1 Tax=Pandoraea pneumonica TaxID=2508299 RepID=A0A5E4SNF1_9BURK|nr:ParA family protein [Pandoraea pneumonica]VVD75918.1 ATPase [Pandoraea pneumonica]